MACKQALALVTRPQYTNNMISYPFTSPPQVEGLTYFSCPVRLGKEGVEEVLPLGNLNALEEANLTDLKESLAAQIQKGIEFASK